MSKARSMDDYIKGTWSYALQFESSGHKKTAEFFYDLVDYLKSFPIPAVTVTNVGNKWIPCSERMPEGCEAAELEVLVCTKEKYIEAEFDEAGFALYYPGEKKFRSVYNYHADITENVVAWMYKPKSYKGE